MIANLSYNERWRNENHGDKKLSLKTIFVLFINTHLYVKGLSNELRTNANKYYYLIFLFVRQKTFLIVLWFTVKLLNLTFAFFFSFCL